MSALLSLPLSLCLPLATAWQFIASPPDWKPLICILLLRQRPHLPRVIFMARYKLLLLLTMVTQLARPGSRWGTRLCPTKRQQWCPPTPSRLSPALTLLLSSLSLFTSNRLATRLQGANVASDNVPSLPIVKLDYVYKHKLDDGLSSKWPKAKSKPSQSRFHRYQAKLHCEPPWPIPLMLAIGR